MNSILKHLVAIAFAATAVFAPIALTGSPAEAGATAADTTCQGPKANCPNSDPWDA